MDSPESLRVEPGSKTEAPTLNRDEYFEERKLLIEARQRSYQRVEDMVSGGAAGTLALSITFLEKLAPLPTTVARSLLVSAWACLILSLGLSLTCHWLSARSFSCELDRLDALVQKKPGPTNSWAAANSKVTAVSVFSLLLGVILLATFAYKNAPFSPAAAASRTQQPSDASHTPRPDTSRTDTSQAAASPSSTRKPTAVRTTSSAEARTRRAAVEAAQSPAKVGEKP